MSQDLISDGLNQIMNAKKVGKKELVLRKYSKVLIRILEIMKEKGAINYSLDKEENTIAVSIIKLNDCRSVKPRYYSGWENLDKYLRRFLPSRNFGFLLVSTNKGMMTHQEATSNQIGGSLIAYFY